MACAIAAPLPRRPLRTPRVLHHHHHRCCHLAAKRYCRMLDCAASSRYPSCTARRRSRRTGTRSTMPRSFVKSRAPTSGGAAERQLGLERTGAHRPREAQNRKGSKSPAENLPRPAVACRSKFCVVDFPPLSGRRMCMRSSLSAHDSHAGALALERARGTGWERRCPPLTHRDRRAPAVVPGRRDHHLA